MRLLAAISLLCACGTARPPYVPPSNATASSERAPATTCDALRGTLSDGLRPVSGATMVASGAHGPADDAPVVITDEQGNFEIATSRELETLTIYYADRGFEGAIPRSCDRVTLQIDLDGPPPADGRHAAFVLGK